MSVLPQEASQSVLPLLRQCWLKGIVLTLKEGKLTFKAEKGVMDQTLLADIRTNKPLIIEALTAQPDYFMPRPLGLNERALWFLYRMTPDSSAYNMAYAIKLNSKLTEEAVQYAFNGLLKRHPILCSAYGERDGDPVQWPATIDGSNSDKVSILPLNNGSKKQIQGWISREADKPLQLDQGQVCRGALLVNRIDNEQHLYFTMVIHHIAADFMSFEVLRQELLQLLDGALLSNEKLGNEELGNEELSTLETLVDENSNYRNWSARQQQFVRDGVATEQFWLNQLAGLPQLNLPTDFPHSAKTGSDGEEIQFTLPATTAAQLRQQCQQLEVTPYVWYMAAFQWFMARLSGQDDFIIGTPSSGRLSAEDARLVGYLVNPLAFRCQPDWLQSFDAWVAQVDEQTKQVMTHQGYPFATLVEKLKVPREVGRSPVFQHMFTLNHERPEVGMQGLVEAELLAEQRGAAHELNLVIVDNRQSFVGKWRYNNSLYRRTTVETIRDSFLHCVHQLLADNSQPLRQLDLATPDTGSALNGETLAPLADTAWQSFANAVQTHPDNIALQSATEALTYAQLMQKIDLVAAWLQQRVLQQQGVQDRKTSSNRIGVCLERSVEQVLVMLACWRLGATYVAMDHKWPESRLQYIAQDAELVLVVGQGDASMNALDQSVQGQTTQDQNSTPNWLPDNCGWMSLSELSAQLQSHSSHPLMQTEQLTDSLLPSEKDVAYVIYTSGSTGQPKGVEVSQSNLVYYVTGVLSRLQLSEQASLASLASNGADLGYTALYGALLSGRTLRLLAEDLAFDAEALADELTRLPVDCLKIVPSHLNGILLATERSEWLPRQALVTGGEALSPELLRKVTERQKNMSTFNHYGPTETTVGVIAKKLSLFDEGIALGQPLANVQTRVVDTCGRVVPQGFAGELEVSGPTLAHGYLGQAALTQERFRQVDGKRWYRTGDRVKQINDELCFIGRSDFQVKIRGYRVEPGEVEAWLKQHADDAVVLNVPDERQANRLVAYIVSANTAAAAHDQIESLKTKMLAEFPDYMLPAVWVPVERLPLLGNGKLDRKALPDPDSIVLETEKKTTDAAGQNTEVQLTNTDRQLTNTESVLLGIWQTLLGKPELGIHDNFFANGGDSIMGLQIIAQAKKANITLTPKAIFEHQTIAELALVAQTPENKLEQALLNIAKEVLNKPNLTAHDNFFAVGGDSILSLQIIAKAKAIGISLTPKQVFEYQTMAELAHAAEEQSKIKPDNTGVAAIGESLPTEAFPLTPIQKWFFEQQASTPEASLSHWNQSLLLDSAIDLDMTALRKSVVKLVERHSSLRLAFSKRTEAVSEHTSKAPTEQADTQSTSEWQQIYQPLAANWGERLVQECHDDVTANGTNDDTVLASLQADFRLDQAPLIKFVWLSKSKQLLCAAHHLIMDAVSWQVLLQDLYTEYTRLVSAPSKSNTEPSFIASAARFDQWQTYLSKQANTLDRAAATSYWVAQIQAELPQTDINNTYQKSTQTSVCLNADLTQKLLMEANLAYNTRVQELLLTALAKVLGQWQQLSDITIELEGHGRETGESGLDLSTSVGWFTSRFPQKLSAVADYETALIRNKEKLRRLPEKGMEYGLLRYFSGADVDSSSQAFSEKAHSFVSFNYLGQQDAITNDGPFTLATPLCPGMKSAKAQRPHVLDINAVVLSGELHVEWTYPALPSSDGSDNTYLCIPNIAENYMNELALLIEHCCHPHHGRATAVDFPDAKITDAEFIDLLAELED